MSTKKKNTDQIFIGHQLRKVRKQRGLTQMEVGKILNISKDYVSRIEKGERVPGPHVKAVIDDWMATLTEGNQAVTIEAERILLGHSEISTTQLYTQVAATAKRAAISGHAATVATATL